MTLRIPVYITPMNIVGLAHKSTLIEVSKTIDFNVEDFVFTATHTGEDKNLFVIPYNLRSNEVVYTRYKIIFENGETSSYSPKSMITKNRAQDEYTLDYMSAVPATPHIKITDYNNSDVPHVDLHVTISDLAFYVGDGTTDATSWFLKDVNDKIQWEAKNDKFNLDSIIIPKDNIRNNGIYKIEAYRHVKTGALDYRTLNGTKIINVSDRVGLSNADKSLEVNFDNFKLYENRQSILTFAERINNFQYLSIKIYDRNGILAIDEVQAKTSPVYINTLGLNLGREYTVKTTAFYIDESGDSKNTKIENNVYIAEKAAISNSIMIPDYKTMSAMGFKELKVYKDENLQYLDFTENINTGESLLFIKENILYIGQWLESGFVFNDKFIDLSKLNIDLTTDRRIQIIQKPSGEYLMSFVDKNTGGGEELRVVTFNATNGLNNIYSINITNDANRLTNYNQNLLFGRNIFTNVSGQNILFTLSGSTKTNAVLTLSELLGNTIISRAAIDIITTTPIMYTAIKSGSNSTMLLALLDGVLKFKNLNTTVLNSLDLSLVDTTLSNQATIDAITEIAESVSTGNWLINGALIRNNTIFFTIENQVDSASLSKVFKFFKLDIATGIVTLVLDSIGGGKGYEHWNNGGSIIYGYNYIKVKKNYPSVILTATE